MLELRFRRFRRERLIALLSAAALLAPGAAAGGLREALQATLQNHPAVAGQRAQLAARRYAADGVRSQRYPTLTAQAQQYADSNLSVLSGDDLSHPSVLRVRQPIWAFGRIGSSIAAANADVSAERANLLRVRRQLMEESAVAYADVRARHRQIELARRNVAEHEALLAQIERRAEGQLASNADARLAATRLAQARAELERTISEWEGAREELAALTQTTVDTEEPIPEDLLTLPEAVDLIEAAVEESAEMRLKREQLGRAEAEVDRAKTASMPTIYLQADKFYDQPGLRDDSQISVVFEASLDGLGLADRGRRGEAAASRLAARQDLAATRLELRREFDRLQRNRRLQSELITLQSQSLADLEALLASYQRQYETGTKSWLDLMNIQRELFEQRRALAQAQSDREIYSLRLLARIGALDALAGIDEQDDG